MAGTTRRIGWIAALAAGLAVPGCDFRLGLGRSTYVEYCAGCHGASGRGDGEVAATLTRQPPDLTGITARNGGTFPQVAVMSTIDGYFRRESHGGVMPEFGPVLQEGRLVLVDTGGGTMTPTPERLVALAEYLETLQRP
jgi:mono/diheme cytochrome c family protein